MTVRFTLILQVNTHCKAKYIDSKMPSDSISEHLFSNFPGGHAPRLPSINMLCMLIFAQ